MNPWEGPIGWLASLVMARMNADMEREAIALLKPASTDTVLEVGCGPGVGLSQLVRVVQAGKVLGVDPSGLMVSRSIALNRKAIAEGRIEIARCDAAHLPWADQSVDGAIAVNSLQLWDPLPASIAEVARVLKPHARLVTLTHAWAIAKRQQSGEWVDRVKGLMEEAGFDEVSVSRAGRARSGKTALIEARRR